MTRSRAVKSDLIKAVHAALDTEPEPGTHLPTNATNGQSCCV
jgi:hypothetical protein